VLTSRRLSPCCTQFGGDDPEVAESGKLILVDLAGMESSKKSYSVEGASSKPQRREEAKNMCPRPALARACPRPHATRHRCGVCTIMRLRSVRASPLLMHASSSRPDGVVLVTGDALPVCRQQHVAVRARFGD
jgi:hypothetical protein